MHADKLVIMRHDAGGEGSRGGKIIGHTSSGKPIYASAKHAGHGKFSPEEHHEAAEEHTRRSRHHKELARHSFGDPTHAILSRYHEAQAARHSGSPLNAFQTRAESQFSEKGLEKSIPSPRRVPKSSEGLVSSAMARSRRTRKRAAEERR